MTWLVLRQARAQIIFMGVLLAALGVLLLVTGLDAASYISAHSQRGVCPGTGNACEEFQWALKARYQLVYMIIGILPMVAHVLVGAFWGGPMIAREVERGTAKLAWTQSITLRQWLSAKLGIAFLIVLIGGLVFSGMVSWWRNVVDQVYPVRFAAVDVFNVTGVSPAVWWTFMFALGAAAGAVFRRTLAALAVAVSVGLIVLPVFSFLRPFYADPVRSVTVDTDAFPRDLLVAGMWLPPTGKEVAQPTSPKCPLSLYADSVDPRYLQCLKGEGYRYVTYHHPSSRYWEFQWKEAALLGAMAVLLTGVTVARTRRLRAV
ncbi:hypothetical protein [Microbispora hainanensis]|uniref:ABC transporter permease n=1 Tax=Microbispora hainanensis TaxID=568844 RepID=A0ABZ1SMS5_9ACTN|nr:hypothetical protein [Microbispora hainanensis]